MADDYTLTTEQALGDEIARVRHGQDVTASDLANRLMRWLAEHDAKVRAETLREAADVIHAEARWQMEQKMRGAVHKSGAETAVERFLVLEELVRERAALTEKEAGL